MITLELEVEEVNAVLGGLGELPAKAVMGLIQKIQRQAQPQLMQQPPEVEEGEGAE